MPRARITWVRPETIHLTVKFLGDIEGGRAEALREKVRAAIDLHPAIDIPLERIGAFPRPQAPRAFWIGPLADWEHSDDAKRVGEMVKAIDDTCAALGVARDEHPWRPHLTLARVRDREREVGRALMAGVVFDRPISAGVLRISEIALMKSDLEPDGPRYSTLWTIP